MRESRGERQLSQAESFQLSIEAYRSRLYQAVQASGAYAGGRIDHERRALIFYGVGEPSPEVAAIMAEAPDALEVVWRAAPYTHAELAAETERIMTAPHRLSTGGPRTDCTGLDFTTTDLELLAAENPRSVLGSKYPVTISYGERPTRN